MIEYSGIFFAGVVVGLLAGFLVVWIVEKLNG